MLRSFMTLAGLVLLVSAITAGPAHAQVNPFKGSAFSLTAEDLEIIKAAAAKLYTVDGVALGTVESWANPQSGNYGTIKLARSFQYKGMPCRRLVHKIQVRKSADQNWFYIDRCQVPDGSWKIR